MKKLLLALLFFGFAAPVMAFESASSADKEKDENIQYAEPIKKKVVMPKPTANASLLKKVKSNASSGSSFKIIALINGEVLSSEDVQNRINAFAMTTNIPVNAQTEPMIFQRVLHNAVDEKLKVQDAQKNGIEISEKEIDDAIKGFEKGNSVAKGELSSLLRKNGVSEDTFRSQIKSDLAWVKLVRKKSLMEGGVTQKEIETALSNAKKDLSIEKYMISEILIRKEDAQNLQGLVSNLRQDPRFELYAMQFSQSPSASSGGKLGWVSKNNLNPKFEKALLKMKENEISEPINIGGDFYILKLNKTFNPKKDDTPELSEEDMKKFLESKRMDDIANKHLQYLRQTAVIELRN